MCSRAGVVVWLHLGAQGRGGDVRREGILGCSWETACCLSCTCSADEQALLSGLDDPLEQGCPLADPSQALALDISCWCSISAAAFEW